MRFPRTIVTGLLTVFTLTACDRDAGPAPSPAPTAATTAPAAATEPVRTPPPPPPPPPATARAAVTPEELTIDAERDPKVRERAAALNAIAVAELKNLKPGDVAVVLVRGDKGGGTIYGSGPYTLDSQLRRAVVHNGAVAHQQLGVVRVKVIKHDGEHPSVPANGIAPTAWGKYHTSYTIEAVPE